LIRPLSLHDALPIYQFARWLSNCRFSHLRYDAYSTLPGLNNVCWHGRKLWYYPADGRRSRFETISPPCPNPYASTADSRWHWGRSEEHTSELQSRFD